MKLPSPIATFMLCYLCGLLPWMAWRSKQRVDAARHVGETALPSLNRIYLNTLLSLGLIFWLSFLVSREIGRDLFAIGDIGARELLWSFAIAMTSLALGVLSRYVRSATELREMNVFKLVPRSRDQWALFVLVACAAGIAEEAAYRGMLTTVVTWMTGSALVGVMISALAFGAAHFVQGWKSVAIIVAKALLMQTLVSVTGTLVLAMVCHALLDMIMAVRTSRLATRLAIP